MKKRLLLFSAITLAISNLNAADTPIDKSYVITFRPQEDITKIRDQAVEGIMEKATLGDVKKDMGVALILAIAAALNLGHLYVNGQLPKVFLSEIPKKDRAIILGRILASLAGAGGAAWLAFCRPITRRTWRKEIVNTLKELSDNGENTKEAVLEMRHLPDGRKIKFTMKP